MLVVKRSAAHYRSPRQPGPTYPFVIKNSPISSLSTQAALSLARAACPAAGRRRQLRCNAISLLLERRHVLAPWGDNTEHGKGGVVTQSLDSNLQSLCNGNFSYRRPSNNAIHSLFMEGLKMEKINGKESLNSRSNL